MENSKETKEVIELMKTLVLVLGRGLKKEKPILWQEGYVKALEDMEKHLNGILTEIS